MSDPDSTPSKSSLHILEKSPTRKTSSRLTSRSKIICQFWGSEVNIESTACGRSMTELRETFGRYARRVTVFGALLVAATATVSAQPHGGGDGGAMGGWGAFGGWMFLWPVVLIGLLALLVFWAGSRPRSERTDSPDRPDRALEELRERYARGDLSDEEFERRRRNLRP